MTIESVEGAVFTAVQAALPAAITAANAGYADGVTIPAIATWYRGLQVDVQESNPARIPALAVGCYRDDPIEPGEAAEWGSQVQRPVVVAFVMTGATGQIVHLRTIRLVDVVKRVLRGLRDSLVGSVVMYWPWDLHADWDEPVPYGVAGLWVTTAMIEAETVRVLEELTT